MKQKLIYAGAIVGAVVLALAVWVMWRPANNANFPEGTDWLCVDPACKTHFKMTMKQLGEHYKENYGKRPLCPKCSKESVRAEVCGHCGKVYAASQGPNYCPYCRKLQVVKPD